MQTRYSVFRIVRKALLVVLSVFSVSHAQTVYFHQDFAKTTSLVNPLPDTSQFSHMILTAPQLSYHKFHKGYLELVRSQQDSATGGIIRAMRATPFQPSPQTLMIQITLSAESLPSDAANAIYLYVGENFNPVNNSFPGNDLMFSKCAVSFVKDSMIIKDPETQRTSRSIPIKKRITLTWVLNNSNEMLTYQIPGDLQERAVSSGTYDLWVDNEPVCLGATAYPGNAEFSTAKLSNFELRFRNGLGKIRIYDILIREGKVPELPAEAIAMPNPVSGNSFSINTDNMDMSTLQLFSLKGIPVAFDIKPSKKGFSRIFVPEYFAPGFYILCYKDLQRRRKNLRIVVQ